MESRKISGLMVLMGLYPRCQQILKVNFLKLVLISKNTHAFL